MTDSGTTRPTPDPTVLTTEQLLREIANLKDWCIALFDGHTAVTAEKFEGMLARFDAIERQRVEQKADTEKAVQAAFSAAKEAVREQTAASDRAISKSENATAEQLRQLSTTFTTAIESDRSSIADVKDRVSKIENLKVGASEQRTNQTESRAGFYAAMACAVGILGVLIIAMNMLSGS